MESRVRDWLAASLGPSARVEVHCSAGIADIVTDSEVIEVKRASLWKAGLGQVLAYSPDFPALGRRLHLFHADEASAVQYTVASQVCGSLAVAVSHSSCDRHGRRSIMGSAGSAGAGGSRQPARNVILAFGAPEASPNTTATPAPATASQLPATKVLEAESHRSAGSVTNPEAPTNRSASR